MIDRGSDGLADEILISLRRIIRAIDLHSRRLQRRCGITGPQLLVLRAVGGADLSTSALARSLSISLPTASDIVRRLEKGALVVRRRNPADRREVLVSLTSAGREVLAEAPPPLQESFTGQLAALEEWEQTQVLSVLQRVVAMMEAESLDASPVLAPGEITPIGLPPPPAPLAKGGPALVEPLMSRARSGPT